MPSGDRCLPGQNVHLQLDRCRGQNRIEEKLANSLPPLLIAMVLRRTAAFPGSNPYTLSARCGLNSNRRHIRGQRRVPRLPASSDR